MALGAIDTAIGVTGLLIFGVAVVASAIGAVIGFVGGMIVRLSGRMSREQEKFEMAAVRRIGGDDV